MKFSIITPSFNQGEFIERTILSVISQNYKKNEFEYIVIDGGSTDKTISILERYSKQLTWKSEKDNGQSHAVNKGFQRTTGDVLGWLNSDDIYYPNTLKEICNFFEAHPDVDIVYGDAYYIDRFDTKTGYYPTESWNFNRLKVRCFLPQPAVFFRRKVLLNHGLLDESLRFCMDYGYWLRLGASGVKFSYLPKILAGVRIYKETKSFQHCLGAALEVISTVQQKLGYIPSAWLVRHSCAHVKKTSKLTYPELKFIVAVWTNLWKTTGLYHQDVYRIFAWIASNYSMLKEFCIRNFTILKIKLRSEHWKEDT